MIVSRMVAPALLTRGRSDRHVHAGRYSNKVCCPPGGSRKTHQGAASMPVRSRTRPCAECLRVASIAEAVMMAQGFLRCFGAVRREALAQATAGHCSNNAASIPHPGRATSSVRLTCGSCCIGMVPRARRIVSRGTSSLMTGYIWPLCLLLAERGRWPRE